MKKLIAILSIILIAFTIQVSAQTKKAKKQPKKTVSTKKTSTVKKARYTPPAEPKQTAPAAVKRSATVTDDFYKTALGLKFLYGISLTGKHFLNDKAALEGILQYRNNSGFGTEFNFTALYEHHGIITGATGLRWYAGGGAYAGYLSYDNDQLEELVDESSSLSLGITGVLGLEYKFKNIPLAISADWQPVYFISGNSGFAAENGGLGVKYTF